MSTSAYGTPDAAPTPLPVFRGDRGSVPAGRAAGLMRVVFLTFVFVLGLGAAIDAITFSRKSLREQIMSLPEPLRAVVWQSGIFGQAAACKYPEARLIGAMIPHSALVDRLSGRSREVPLLRQRLIARASTMQLAGRGQPCPVVFAALETLAASLERSVPR